MSVKTQNILFRSKITYFETLLESYETCLTSIYKKNLYINYFSWTITTFYLLKYNFN